MICLTLAETRIERALQHVVDCQNDIDICELRVDYLLKHNIDAIAQFPASLFDQGCGVKSIMTIRRVEDGGRYRGAEQERLALLRNILEQGNNTTPFQYVDLELDIRGGDEEQKICTLAQEQNITIIRSVHDFSPKSIDLSSLLEQVTADRREIGKVAVSAKSLTDVCEAIEQLQTFRSCKKNSGVRVIAIAMGEYGQILRILAKRLGIYCTYCSVPKTEEVAPGQLDPVVLNRLYNYHDINTQTKLFAIVGNPIAHSKSPQFHNRLFHDRKKNACYLPIKCDTLPALSRLSSLLPLAGFSVTLPHKVDIVRRLDEADNDVRAAGACNTVIVRQGKWHGYNTDLYGFEQPLFDQGILKRSAIRRGKALIIGAGGVARTVCASLLRHGYEICVMNRSEKRMRDLVSELRAQYPQAAIHAVALSPNASSQIQLFNELIIQTTSVGMEPKETDDPIPFYSFSGHEVVYDLIYTPARTVVLERAERAGCTVINGEGMFVAQAEKQSERFFDIARY